MLRLEAGSRTPTALLGCCVRPRCARRRGSLERRTDMWKLNYSWVLTVLLLVALVGALDAAFAQPAQANSNYEERQTRALEKMARSLEKLERCKR